MGSQRASKGAKREPAVHVHVTTGGRAKKDKSATPPAAGLEKDIAEKLGALRASLTDRSGLEVRVWRYNNAERDYEYLNPIRLEDFAGIETVRQLFGGGKYYVRVAETDGGRFVAAPGIGGRFEFIVGGPPRHPDAQPTGGGVMEVQLAELRASVQRLTEKLAERPNAPATDPGAIAAQMAAAFAGVQSATLKAAGDMFGRNSAPREASDPFSMIEAILALAERIGNKGGEGSDPLAMAVLQIGQRAFDNIEQARAEQRRLTDGGAAATNGGGSMNVRALAPMIKQLVGLAKGDKDPELYADVLLDQLSDYPAVLAELRNRTAPEQRAELQNAIAAAFPDVRTYAGWFDNLWAHVWARFDEPPEEVTPA